MAVVVGFAPFMLLLDVLRRRFGAHALFLADLHARTCIGVVWRARPPPPRAVAVAMLAEMAAIAPTLIERIEL